MKTKFSQFVSESLHHANVPRIICDHVISKEHSVTHRRYAGVMVAVFGVIVSKGLFIPIETHVVSVVFDTVGYFLHAVGGIPFLEPLIRKYE